MNPFDELSIEEAVRLRERKLPVDAITTLSIGPAKAADVLRTALAMGADRGVHVETSAGAEAGQPGEGTGGLEPLDVAKTLQRVIETTEEGKGTNVVILGKQSIDDDAGQTGQMLAGLLGWSQATQASKVEFPDPGDVGTVRVTREVDGGVETLQLKLPVVITTDLRLNEPRYASLPNIMKAKKKPLVKKTLEELGITPGNRLKTVKVEEPPPRKGGVKVEDVDGLVGKLKELGAL
jgi:electron transfer flavoprotein beta subunit